MAPSTHKQHKPHNGSAKSSRFKLMLVGVPVELKKRDLFNFFSSTFETKDLFFEMKKRKKTKKNQGWAVIHVPTKQIYERALEQKQFLLAGKKIFANRYMQGEELKKFKRELNQRRLFLKGVPQSFTDEDIRNYFKKFGDLEDAYCVRRKVDQQHHSQGEGFCYALVIFKKVKDAERLLKLEKLVMNDIVLDVQQFRTKEEKARQKKPAQKSGSFRLPIPESFSMLNQCNHAQSPSSPNPPPFYNEYSQARLYKSGGNITEDQEQSPHHWNYFVQANISTIFQMAYDEACNRSRAICSPHHHHGHPSPQTTQNQGLSFRKTKVNQLPNLDFSGEQNSTKRQMLSEVKSINQKHSYRNLRLNFGKNKERKITQNSFLGASGYHF